MQKDQNQILFAIHNTQQENPLIWKCDFGRSYLSKNSLKTMSKSLILLFLCVFYFFITQKQVSPITAAVPPYGGTMEEPSVSNGVNF